MPLQRYKSKLEYKFWTRTYVSTNRIWCKYNDDLWIWWNDVFKKIKI